MIQRDVYLQKLLEFQDKRVIKIITGVRRCGKSTMFDLFKDSLVKNGVIPGQIQTVNFDDADNIGLTDWQTLHKHIQSRLLPDRMNYVFLDEIQNVAGFQKAANSLYIKPNVDLYLTGSNAYMLSGELATLLSGRYVEIRMLPLSFKEYVSALPEQTDLPRKYSDYLTNSSFPYALELSGHHGRIRDYLDGIYNTVVLKDIVTRKKIADVSLLDGIIRFMFDNIGNLCSIKKISDTLTSDGRKISPHTVDGYLRALTDSFILYRAGRYDIKGKQHLKTGEKYYLVDIGLRYFLLGSRGADFGRILENVVYLELLRRGYEVYIGKAGDAEVDFVAAREGNTEYYQVALTVLDETILKRELAPLNAIGDHNSKFLLTMDVMPDTAYNGIRQRNALDWLLS